MPRRSCFIPESLIAWALMAFSFPPQAADAKQRRKAASCAVSFRGDKKAYPSYKKFTKILRKHDVQTQREFTRRRQELMQAEGALLPAKPEDFYEEWEGWGAVTGSGRAYIHAKDLPSYEEFIEIVRKHHVMSLRHYKLIRQALMEAAGRLLPSRPETAYGERWEGWGAVLGFGRKPFKREDYPSLRAFKALIRKHGVKSAKDYQAKREAMAAELGKPLPANPERFYGKKWPGWGAVTGSGKQRIKASEAPSYEEFIKIMQEYQVRSKNDYLKRREEIMRATGLKLPYEPHIVYKEWEGWGAVVYSAAIISFSIAIPHDEKGRLKLRRF